MAGADPSQFQMTPSALQSQAVDRRMNAMNNGMGNIPQVLSSGQTPAASMTSTGAPGSQSLTQLPGIPPLPSYGGNSGGQQSMTPVSAPPLAGGSGRNPFQNPTSPWYDPTAGQGGGSTFDPNNPLSGGTGDPTLDSYLGTDTTYQGQLSNLMKQLDMYNAQKNLTASQTQADYDARQRALSDQAVKDRQQMLNNFGARGVLNSGIYANSLGQYNQDNQQQVTNLLGGLQNSQDNAQMAYNNFISQELAAKQNAIQEAAARRAQALGQF